MKNRLHAVASRPIAGFSLVEVMIAVGLFSLVVAGSLGAYVMCQKFWQATSLNIQTCQLAEMALEKMLYGVGTNTGLRAASSINFRCYPSNATDSAYVHSHLSPASYTYWENSSLAPPQANDYRLDFYCSYATFNDGGSWRLMFSNSACGAQYFEYNAPFHTLSLGTNNQNRILLATYVSRANIVTNSQGIDIAVTVSRRSGNLTASNTAATFVYLRNNP